MLLLVNKFHNYSKALESETERDEKPSELFYFCFFELSNGRKICFQTYKTYDKKIDVYEWNTFMTVNKDGEDLDLGEYSYSYANDYVFGEDFSDWFERSLKIPAHSVTEHPTDQESKCVIEYYEKNIKQSNH